MTKVTGTVIKSNKSSNSLKISHLYFDADNIPIFLSCPAGQLGKKFRVTKDSLFTSDL